MRFLALFLSVIAVGLYVWPTIESEFFAEPVKGGSVREVFPQTMIDIRPVSDVQSVLEKRSITNAQQTQSQESSEQSPKEEPSTTAVVENEADSNVEQQDDSELMCVKLGPVSSKRLPVLNQSLEQQKLLEQVSVEPILGDDHWIVFIIPSGTKKGALAQANQMKRLGYKNAVAITEGPLLNGVSLNTFADEERARAFLQQVQDKTKMQGIRVTRIIGQPTSDVFLIFANISQEQYEKVATIGRHHKQQLQPCF